VTKHVPANAPVLLTGTSPLIAANNAAIADALNTAHHLLVAADHDYAGHRHKAAVAVWQAMNELGYPENASTGADSGSGNSEIQVMSDTQLRTAQDLLQQVRGSLSVRTHSAARAHVSAAIGEISRALAVR